MNKIDSVSSSVSLVPWMVKFVMAFLTVSLMIALPIIPIAIVFFQNYKRIWGWYSGSSFFEVPKTEDDLVLEMYKKATEGVKPA